MGAAWRQPAAPVTAQAIAKGVNGEEMLRGVSSGGTIHHLPVAASAETKAAFREIQLLDPADELALA
jgi:hypothetical protein